jgi:hypothetical protein
VTGHDSRFKDEIGPLSRTSREEGGSEKKDGELGKLKLHGKGNKGVAAGIK